MELKMRSYYDKVKEKKVLLIKIDNALQRFLKTCISKAEGENTRDYSPFDFSITRFRHCQELPFGERSRILLSKTLIETKRLELETQYPDEYLNHVESLKDAIVAVKTTLTGKKVTVVFKDEEE